MESVNKLLQQEVNHKFPDPGVPIRLIFSKFLRFQEDKFIFPNVFCWFGFHAVPENGNVDFNIVDELFKKHHALFIDDYDSEIKAVIFEKYEEENIRETFNTFYGNVILYDLILQWVSEEGDFKYNYGWLSNKSEEMTPIIKANFKHQFGISPDEINIL